MALVGTLITAASEVELSLHKHWSVTGLRSLRHEPCFLFTYLLILLFFYFFSAKLKVLQVLQLRRHTRSI